VKTLLRIKNDEEVLKIAAEVTFEDLFAKASLDGDPIIS
jgi:hypothetical protein